MPASLTHTCPLCIDELTSPICPPCGHIMCQKCLTSYIETKPEPLKIPCPICKVPFSEAILDRTPEKYLTFLAPHLRAVFLPEVENPLEARVEELEKQLVALQKTTASQESEILRLNDKLATERGSWDIERNKTQDAYKKLEEKEKRTTEELRRVQAARLDSDIEKIKMILLNPKAEVKIPTTTNTNTRTTSPGIRSRGGQSTTNPSLFDFDFSKSTKTVVPTTSSSVFPTSKLSPPESLLGITARPGSVFKFGSPAVTSAPGQPSGQTTPTASAPFVSHASSSSDNNIPPPMDKSSVDTSAQQGTQSPQDDSARHEMPAVTA
ncbi:hypothetical protein ABKN59_004369 [Abortiporus biennis]